MANSWKDSELQEVDLVKFATHAARCEERVLLVERTKLPGIEPMMDDPTWLAFVRILDQAIAIKLTSSTYNKSPKYIV